MSRRRTFLRKGHGQGSGRPHVEIGKIADLPVGVPGPARPAPVRGPSGRFAPGDGTRALAREGGKARAASLQLAQLLGLQEVAEDSPFAPYARLAREWRDDYIAALAASVGGGEVGPGPASIASSAALQLAASRFLSDRGAAAGDPKMLAEASKLANDSRQNIAAAHSLAALEAEGRPRVDTIAALRASLGAGK